MNRSRLRFLGAVAAVYITLVLASYLRFVTLLPPEPDENTMFRYYVIDWPSTLAGAAGGTASVMFFWWLFVGAWRSRRNHRGNS